MKTKYFIPLLLLTISSCNKIDDLYDSSKLQEEAKENFPVKEIDPNQDWDMTTVKTISVTVNNTENDVYTFKVYTENPFNSDSNAKLMCIKENVKNGSTFDLVFDAPKVYTTAYLLLIDSKGMEYMKTFDVSSDKTSFIWSNKSTTSRAVSRYATRAVNTIQGPSDSNFPSSVPDNIESYPSSWKENVAGCNYLLNNENADFHENKNASNLYIEGNVTLNVNGNVDHYNLYVMPNAKLTLSGSLISNDIVIYVCSGATLIANGINSSGKIYNRGTIDFNNSDLASYEGLIVYNEGTINNIKELNLTNTASLYNSGIINAVNFEMNSSSVLYNECIGDDYNNSGVIKISGTTTLSNKKISFTNNHKFETNSLQTYEYNTIIDNNCYLKIDNNASFEGTIINMGEEAYINANNISMNNTTVNLKNKAWINSNSILYNYGNVINGNATTSLVYSKKSTAVSGLCVTYKGNLYVASNKHFKNSNSSTFKNDETVNFVSYSSVHVSNPINKICDTYDFGIPSTPTQDDTQCYTYAFEDMLKEVGDYDFNDVVVKVSTVPINNKLTVKLVAAGATKNLIVKCKLDGKDVSIFNNREVHDAFGVDSKILVNTGNTTADEVIDEITVPEGFNNIKNRLDIYITEVGNTHSVHIPNFTSGFQNGDVPYAILVPCDWVWPSEKQCIDKKYTSFENWAQNALSDNDWYNK